MARMEKIGCFGLTTTAKSDGDNWILNGQKKWRAFSAKLNRDRTNLTKHAESLRSIIEIAKKSDTIESCAIGQPDDFDRGGINATVVDEFAKRLRSPAGVDRVGAVNV